MGLLLTVGLLVCCGNPAHAQNGWSDPNPNVECTGVVASSVVTALVAPTVSAYGCGSICGSCYGPTGFTTGSETVQYTDTAGCTTTSTFSITMSCVSETPVSTATDDDPDAGYVEFVYQYTDPYTGITVKVTDDVTASVCCA